MISIDTNVLLQRLLNDDVGQAEKVRKLFDKEKLILITDIVLAEVIWTLRGKRYKASKANIVEVVMSLIEEPNVRFENQDAIWAALNDYIDAPRVQTAKGMREAEFVDALVVNKSKVVIQPHREPYEATYTFDIAAQALAGTKVP